MADRNPVRFAYIALTLGLLSIGASAIFVSSANAPGTITAFYRMAIAAVAALPFFLWRLRSSERRISNTGLIFALLGGLFFALDLTFWTTGIDHSGATKPTLMANTAPLWVGLGSMLIFGERPAGAFWIGLLTAIVGAALVLGVDLMEDSAVGLGTFLGLLAAVFYGGYYLVTQRGRSLLNTLEYFWLTTASSAVVLLLLNTLLSRPLVGYDRQTWYNFLAIGLLVQLLGWMLINYAQGYIKASVVAPTLLLQPVVTAILAVIILGESFSPLHIVGGLVVLAGVFVVHRSRTVALPTVEPASDIQELIQ